MEELRSTDILDKEIREDSQKKADKILAKAEETARALLNDVDSRISKAEEDARKASEDRLDIFRRNVNASLPLEKHRCLVSYINDSVVDAIKKYFEKADSSKKEQIIEKLLKKAKSVTGDSRVNALACGSLSTGEAEKILKAVYGSACTGVSKQKNSDENDVFSYGIILSTEDGKITCRLTIEEKINELLSQNREQLALGLFGGRLPE